AMLVPVILAACAAYVLLDFWLLRALRRLRAVPAPPSAAAPLVTVLVAARDEEAHLPRLLDALLAQDWPASRTQIVVINDRSHDDTAGVLRAYGERFPGRLETVTIHA